MWPDDEHEDDGDDDDDDDDHDGGHSMRVGKMSPKRKITER